MFGGTHSRLPVQVIRLRYERGGAAFNFAALQLWIMFATALDPRLHTYLLRQFGLDWHQLATGQLWRLVTAPPLQTSAGFVC